MTSLRTTPTVSCDAPRAQFSITSLLAGLSVGLSVAALAFGGVACKSDGGGRDGGGGDSGIDSIGGDGDGDGDGEGDGDGDDQGVFDVGGGGTTDGTTGDTGNGCVPVGGDATLTGTVFAPNQTIPVSGALVYVTDSPPMGIPQKVYCAECVELPCSTPFALSNPDGSFSFSAPSGSKYLVVQKGQFMRVTSLTLNAGQNALGANVTSLPDRNEPANGLYIPRIALAVASYDKLEDGLAKLGLGDTVIGAGEEVIVEGTEQFDMWNLGRTWPGASGSFNQLVANKPLLDEYHIIFIGCDSDDANVLVSNPQAMQNLRDWVAEGGKLYVADWSSEWITLPFAQYQQIDPDLLPAYDSLGTVLDADMLAWLNALPDAIKNINPANVAAGGTGDHPTLYELPQVLTKDSFSVVTSTPPVLVDDGMGGQVDVGHKVWIEGPGAPSDPSYPVHPLTITGQYGCGKIMFTSYHTAEYPDAYVGLTPQELVLMYLILEIGVCQVPTPPPPPVG